MLHLYACCPGVLWHGAVWLWKGCTGVCEEFCYADHSHFWWSRLGLVSYWFSFLLFVESSLGCHSSLWFAEKMALWVLIVDGDTVQGKKRQLISQNLLCILNEHPSAVLGWCWLLSIGLARWWISPTKMGFFFASWERHHWWLPVSFWHRSCICWGWKGLGWALDQFLSRVWEHSWVGWAYFCRTVLWFGFNGSGSLVGNEETSRMIWKPVLWFSLVTGYLVGVRSVGSLESL